MREFIGRIIRWFTHEHDYEPLLRTITYREIFADGKWAETTPGKVWLNMTWFMQCKNCKKFSKKKFNSNL